MQLTDVEAIEKYDAGLVLCAWMDIGHDWTPAWRARGVREYVLIGDLSTDEPSYSLNNQHPGYARLLLEEVSREMWDPRSAPPEGGRRTTSLCAVAFRRDEFASSRA